MGVSAQRTGVVGTLVDGNLPLVFAVVDKAEKEAAGEGKTAGARTGYFGLKRILVTGGTGLVGSLFAERNANVLVATRNPQGAKQKLGTNIVDAIEWSNTSRPIELSAHQPIHAVVNLMGESVAEGRWNADKKKRIYDSRILGTRNLIDSIRKLDDKPEVLISASAVGYYGDPGDFEVDENHPPAAGFLAETCKDWEREALAAAEIGIRVCLLRIGIVMSRDGGALAEMLPIFEKGLGGRLGNGRQYFPWIHVSDLVALIGWAIENESASGVYNAVAPNPVTNREFTRQLATTLGRPAILPVPRFALRLALGEFADSLFYSQRIVPAAALRDGFKFRFNELDECLADLFAEKSSDV